MIFAFDIFKVFSILVFDFQQKNIFVTSLVPINVCRLFQVMYLDLIVGACSDIMSRRLPLAAHLKRNRGLLVAVVTVVGFLLSLAYVGPSGIYVVLLLETYTGVALLGICIAEIVAIIHGYGFRRFLAYVRGFLCGAWCVGGKGAYRNLGFL